MHDYHSTGENRKNARRYPNRKASLCLAIGFQFAHTARKPVFVTHKKVSTNTAAWPAWVVSMWLPTPTVSLRDPSTVEQLPTNMNVHSMCGCDSSMPKSSWALACSCTVLCVFCERGPEKICRYQCTMKVFFHKQIQTKSTECIYCIFYTSYWHCVYYFIIFTFDHFIPASSIFLLHFHYLVVSAWLWCVFVYVCLIPSCWVCGFDKDPCGWKFIVIRTNV